MKTLRIWCVILGIIAALVCLYRFAVRPADAFARKIYYDLVVKNLTGDKSALVPDSGIRAGLYRPELPYHYDELFAIEESLGIRFDIVSFYQAWGYGEEYAFSPDVYTNITRGGYIPFVTWEPWVVALDTTLNQSPDSSLARIAAGQFDDYIRTWARNAARFGKAFFLRPGHEMSNPQYPWSSRYGNSPELYKRFWRHVHALFQQEGATNVAFVWNPYTSEDTVFYPGDRYVDWIGLDVFNYGNMAQGGGWLSFYTITKLLYDAVTQYDKPIIVAEAGCVDVGGNRAHWYRDMFHSLAVDNFPQIKGLVLFDTPNAKTPTGLRADLGFSSDPAVYEVVDKKELTRQLHLRPFDR